VVGQEGNYRRFRPPQVSALRGNCVALQMLQGLSNSDFDGSAIRVGNEPSEQAFRRSGYREACCFFNAATDNHVAVWQKVLSIRQ
jgi:hypothetical protein